MLDEFEIEVDSGGVINLEGVAMETVVVAIPVVIVTFSVIVFVKLSIFLSVFLVLDSSNCSDDAIVGIGELLADCGEGE